MTFSWVWTDGTDIQAFIARLVTGQGYEYHAVVEITATARVQ